MLLSNYRHRFNLTVSMLMTMCLLFVGALHAAKPIDLHLYQAATSWLAQDYPGAFERFSRLAKSGNALAQDRLASLYFYGEGVKQDYHQAFLWYQKAAQQDFLAAQYMLGYLYLHGLGVEQNYALARRWLLTVAKTRIADDPLDEDETSDPAKLQQQITQIVYEGRRFVARYWVWLAQRDLGALYSHGWGVTQNPIEAYAWYHVVASYGDVLAVKRQQAIVTRLNAKQLITAKRLAALYVQHYGIHHNS